MEQSLFWIDRSGQASRLTDETGTFSTPRLSPDGKRLAVTVAEGDGTDVWLLDIERDTFTQLTTDGASQYPDWSPDGEWLVFSSGSSNPNLFRIRSDFSSPPELVLEREGIQMHTRWTPDGNGLVFQEDFASRADIWVLDLEGDTEPRLFLQTPVNESQPDLSPDGRFIIYRSMVSGDTSQVFAQPFTGPGGRRQISTDGGRNPRWSPTGREIFYLDRARQAIMAVEVRTEPELEAGHTAASLRVADRPWIIPPLGRHARRSAFRGSGHLRHQRCVTPTNQHRPQLVRRARAPRPDEMRDDHGHHG